MIGAGSSMSRISGRRRTRSSTSRRAVSSRIVRWWIASRPSGPRPVSASTAAIIASRRARKPGSPKSSHRARSRAVGEHRVGVEADVERRDVVERGALRRVEPRLAQVVDADRRRSRRVEPLEPVRRAAHFTFEPAGEPEVRAAVLERAAVRARAGTRRARRGASASTASASSHRRTAVSGSVADERRGPLARPRRRRPRASTISRAPCSGRRAVEVERRVLVEPAGVRLPDRAHAPVDAAVRLAEIEVLGQADLAHRGPHVVPVVHRGDGRVVHVLHRVADPLALRADQSPRRAPARDGRAAASRVRGRSRAAPSRRTRARCACGRRASSRGWGSGRTAPRTCCRRARRRRRAATRRASRWSRRRAR